MKRAVIQVLGKQYHVEPGSKIHCHKMHENEGDKVELPILGSFSDFKTKGIAKCTILEHYLDEKKVVFYKTQRGHDRHRRGFRAKMTLLQIDSIEEVKK